MECKYTVVDSNRNISLENVLHRAKHIHINITVNIHKKLGYFMIF